MLFAAFSDETNRFLGGLLLLVMFANMLRKAGRAISNNPGPSKIVAKGLWGVVSRKMR